jgi:ATP-binding cassette subfamily F protein uup
MGTARLRVEQAEVSGRLVFEAEQVRKAYGSHVVVADFSTRIMRGDRVGLIGPNGAGKTTLLRLLLKELEPDSGDVRHGTNVQIAYYDQQREQLDPERTVFETVGEGRDTVTVNGQPRHLNGYLRDFLFPPERARSPVKSLSGGERNRLLLARLFTRPANVLVLDEPTNDLDLETLELLEEQLVEWAGTLLLVSHDRVFLDNVVTSTIVFEGEGRTVEYVGGYADWLRQRPAAARTVSDADGSRPASSRPGASVRDVAGRQQSPPGRRKLTYNEQRELSSLPARIEALEAEHASLEAAVASPDFYKEGADTIAQTLDRIASVEQELLDAYSRADELKERA